MQALEVRTGHVMPSQLGIVRINWTEQLAIEVDTPFAIWATITQARMTRARPTRVIRDWSCVGGGLHNSKITAATLHAFHHHACATVEEVAHIVDPAAGIESVMRIGDQPVAGVQGFRTLQQQAHGLIVRGTLILGGRVDSLGHFL